MKLINYYQNNKKLLDDGHDLAACLNVVESKQPGWAPDISFSLTKLFSQYINQYCLIGNGNLSRTGVFDFHFNHQFKDLKFDPNKVTIKSAINGGMVDYVIKGELKNVVLAIHSVVCSYHPSGYGTTLQTIIQEDDGQYTAHMFRSTCAD